MVGLKEGTVVVSEYDETWNILFEKEKKLIVKQLSGDGIPVEHFGSTSVPGLCAKPIIDILIGIDSWENAFDYVQPMERIGYTFKGEFGIPFRHYFVKGDPTMFHVHMVEHNGNMWKEQLLFRNYLRTHPETKTRYADLKKNLAGKYPDDRKKYLDSKAGFIQDVIRKAGVTMPDKSSK